MSTLSSSSSSSSTIDPLTVQSSHSGDGSTTAWWEDVSDGDILDRSRVNSGSLQDFLENGSEEILGAGLREATLLGLCDGGTDGST